jgi:hypothetical protein
MSDSRDPPAPGTPSMSGPANIGPPLAIRAEHPDQSGPCQIEDGDPAGPVKTEKILARQITYRSRDSANLLREMCPCLGGSSASATSLGVVA